MANSLSVDGGEPDNKVNCLACSAERLEKDLPLGSNPFADQASYSVSSDCIACFTGDGDTKANDILWPVRHNVRSADESPRNSSSCREHSGKFTTAAENSLLRHRAVTNLSARRSR